MKKLKALILGTLLLVPLLVFAFFMTFGEQHFILRTYLPELSDTGEVMRTAKGDTIFRRIPGFKFTDQAGHAVTQKELADGGLYVANFFYTSCPASCRQISSDLMRVQETFRNKPQVKIASFTIDPAHDSVDVLKKYATQYNANPAQWLFLTGPRKEVYRLASEGFSLPVQQVAGRDTLILTEKLMLVDKAHRVRGIYDATLPTEIDRLEMEINVLLDEYSKSK